jgi:anion-transporting  ArsA/GET3 family ATPase
VFTKAAQEERAALVRTVIAAARSYTATADFAERYASFRESQRPERTPLPQNGDEALAAQMKQLDEVAKEAIKLAENMPPQAREDLIENIEFTKRQLAELNKDPKHRANVDAAAREAAKVAAEELQQAMARYDADYPADVRELIVKRLRAFLAISASVDFSAKTIERDDRKVHFVNPSHESMPNEWKMLFRAGKPAVDAARAAAEDWLKALGG